MKPKAFSSVLMARFLAAAIPVALAVATPAATSAQQQTPAPRSGGTLVAAIPADPGLWDPKFTMDTNGIRAEAQIYATLMRNTADAKGVEPWLAESYEASPDLKEVTFHLHRNAKFCDGSPITANDVKFSFDRYLEKDSNVSWQYPEGTTVQAIDDYTAKVTSQVPSVWFLQAMTLWGTNIMSAKYVQGQSKDQIAAAPLGSGPFCLTCSARAPPRNRCGTARICPITRLISPRTSTSTSRSS